MLQFLIAFEGSLRAIYCLNNGMSSRFFEVILIIQKSLVVPPFAQFSCKVDYRSGIRFITSSGAYLQ